MIQWAVAGALWLLLAITQSSAGVERTEPQFHPFFSHLRDSFSLINSGVSPDAASLVAGLAIGDDSGLSEATAVAMQTVGLSHLTAVSGANCAIVIGLVYLLLKRFALNRWARAVAATTFLVFYVLLVGPEPSVLRSSFMAVVVLVVIAAGRPAAAASALALAVIVLLIVNPKLAVSVGFALSVFATLGILVLAPKIHQILATRLPAWLSLPLAVSFAAQISCWPILLQIQDGVATYSLFANLLAEPLVAPITILGLIACTLAIPVPLIAAALAWIASLLTWPIAWIANTLSSMPVSTLAWPSGWFGTTAAVSVLLLLAAALHFNNHRKKLLATIALLVIAAVFTGSNTSAIIRSNTWMKSDWDIVACDVGQGDGLVIRSGGQVAVIDVGRSDRAIDQCLSSLQIETIDLLVLTHYDVDHVGGLSGAIDGRRVAVALVTEFKDDRPAKDAVLGALNERSIPVATAHSGVGGMLGKAKWRVLTPNAEAREAEDSNDASTTLLFESEEYRLLALADLGERGQMRLARVLGVWQNTERPLVLKVSHHGSADQYPELIESLQPDLAIISVGRKNSYGHPTDRTLGLLKRSGAITLRTDELGSVAISTFRNGDSHVQYELHASG